MLLLHRNVSFISQMLLLRGEMFGFFRLVERKPLKDTVIARYLCVNRFKLQCISLKVIFMLHRVIDLHFYTHQTYVYITIIYNRHRFILLA